MTTECLGIDINDTARLIVAESLQRNTRLDVAEALRNMHDMPGTNNVSILVDSNGPYAPLVCRTPQVAQPNTSAYKYEYSILRRIPSGVGPRAYYLDTAVTGRPVLAEEFIQGAKPINEVDRSYEVVTSLAYGLASIHSTEPRTLGRVSLERFLMKGPIPEYVKAVQESEYATAVKHVLARSNRVIESSQGLFDHVPICLLHGDLTKSNILVTPWNRVRFIDFEYAGWGDPAFELGPLSLPDQPFMQSELGQELGFTPKEIGWLHKAYEEVADPDPTREERVRITSALYKARAAIAHLGVVYMGEARRYKLNEKAAIEGCDILFEKFGQEVDALNI